MSSPAATPSRPEVDQEIGAGLRRLRRERSLSLIDLAARTNLSIGFLSQIERGARRDAGALGQLPVAGGSGRGSG